jgi:hypothetical protein
MLHIVDILSGGILKLTQLLCCTYADGLGIRDLLLPAVTLFESAASLLLKTDVDLAGWLGDLAPRGDLDSTQLLYRLLGAKIPHGIMRRTQAVSGNSDPDLKVLQAVTAVTWKGIPLLSLAFSMLKPAAGTSADNSNEYLLEGVGEGKGRACSTGTGSGGGSSSSSSSTGATRSKGSTGSSVSSTQAGSHCSRAVGQSQHSTPDHKGVPLPATASGACESISSGTQLDQPPHRASSSSIAPRARAGASFVEAWKLSPNTLKGFATLCTNMWQTCTCPLQVRQQYGDIRISRFDVHHCLNQRLSLRAVLACLPLYCATFPILHIKQFSLGCQAATLSLYINWNIGTVRVGGKVHMLSGACLSCAWVPDNHSDPPSGIVSVT